MSPQSLTELLVPDFANYLKRYGNVEIRDKLSREFLLNLPRDERRIRITDVLSACKYTGKLSRHPVLLEGKFIGFLEIVDKPYVMVYAGKDPGNDYSRVFLGYRKDRSDAVRSGRIDDFRHIPFP